MDQVKIGQYIAKKRKEKELTQEQLAEKLGKSRKAVSKWERGVCLPDVSVYTNYAILSAFVRTFKESASFFAKEPTLTTLLTTTRTAWLTSFHYKGFVIII